MADNVRSTGGSSGAAQGQKRSGILPGPAAAQPTKKVKQSNAAKPWIKDQFCNDGRCKHCSAVLTSNHSTTLKNHLFNPGRCAFLSSAVAAELAKTVPEVRAARVNADVPGSTGNSAGTSTAAPPSTSGSAHGSRPRPNILDMLRATATTEADQALFEEKLANMIYDTNLAHSWVEHPSVQELFSALRPSFVLPTRYKVCTRLHMTSVRGVHLV